MNNFKQGVKDSLPIAMGYFSVSFSFGILALQKGFLVIQAILTSLTNVTSAGQFAGLQIIVAGGTIAELILTQVIINLRYALMSLSISQKLSEKMTLKQRLITSFAITDEVFAVAMAHTKQLTFPYMIGLQVLPIAAWTAGTAVGALAANVLPHALISALGVALYGMFIAIVIPAAKKSRPVTFTVLLALTLSSIIYYVPAFHFISTGMSIIICTLAASVVSAVLFPLSDRELQGE